jgi:hypothetical protein
MDEGVREHVFIMAAFLKAGKDSILPVWRVSIYGVAGLALFFSKGFML